MTKAIDVPQAKKQKDVYGTRDRRPTRRIPNEDTTSSPGRIPMTACRPSLPYPNPPTAVATPPPATAAFRRRLFTTTPAHRWDHRSRAPPPPLSPCPPSQAPLPTKSTGCTRKLPAGPAPSEDYDYYSKMADSSYPQTNRADVAAPRSQVSDDDDNNDEKKADATVIQETDFLPWPDDPPYPHPLETELGVPVSPSGPLHPHTVLSGRCRSRCAPRRRTTQRP